MISSLKLKSSVPIHQVLPNAYLHFRSSRCLIAFAGGHEPHGEHQAAQGLLFQLLLGEFQDKAESLQRL